MATEKFRHQLRKESAQWRAEGLITEDQHTRLADLYGFDRLETSARDRFIVILIGLGSILLGLGVITFVAANWQAIPRGVKLGVLLVAFLGVNLLAYGLWRRPSRGLGDRQTWHQRLGIGLFLLGALLLGANLALSGQLFHVGGMAYELFWVWGLGVLAMAFGLRLVPLGLMSMGLLGLAYWTALFDLNSWSTIPGLPTTLRLMPLFAGLVFTGLAYHCRSRVIFGLGAIALFSSFFVVVTELADRLPDAPALVACLVLLIPAAVLWSYDDRLWWAIARQPLPLKRPFRPVAQGLAIAHTLVIVYGLSFHFMWTNLNPARSLGGQITYGLGAGRGLWLNPNILGLSLLLVVSWVFLARPTPRRPRWGLTATDSSVLLILGTLGFLLIWHLGIQQISSLATLLNNVILALMAASFIRQGLAQANRTVFWCGLATLALQILSRMLEYDTGLLLKSLAFVLCGVGVIIVGLWFERYVRTLDPPSTLAPQSQEEQV